MLVLDSIKRKTLLYKSGVEYADYCLNHVEGCSHGCTYPCYAFLMKKRCGVVHTYEEWCHPKIVSNAIELLEKEIGKIGHKIDSVHLCFSTDPFMYEQDDIIGMSLQIIKTLNKNNIPVTTLTKGITPKEIVCFDANSNRNQYGITLVSLDEVFRTKYEPNTAHFSDRIEALRFLSEHKCKTYISMEPYPTPNILKQDIDGILDSIKFVDKIIFGRMNYNRDITNFTGFREYYNELAKLVIRFCRKNNIDFHIKDKTMS